MREIGEAENRHGGALSRGKRGRYRKETQREEESQRSSRKSKVQKRTRVQTMTNLNMRFVMHPVIVQSEQDVILAGHVPR